MKLNIQRETLLKPLQQVTGVVERRQTLPILRDVGQVVADAVAPAVEVNPVHVSDALGPDEGGDGAVRNGKNLSLHRLSHRSQKE